ncbi:MAG: ChrR family anti-sigma-E factor [Bauldia sp.]|nr:ChrR family anti-sigma-E factor [Bauldia sp.]
MSITHHPTEETLAAFAAGQLDEARSLVVATHIALCPECREGLHRFESVGGAILAQTVPASMPADALVRSLAALDAPAVASATGQAAMAPRSADGLPAPLGAYELGAWRRIGRGVEWRGVDMAGDEDVRVFMLRAQPGTRLPRHRHKGDEWTCVFEGAFRHEHGRFGPGDFDEADESLEHHPTVETGVPCVCLVALDKGIAFQGWFGRLLQPFVRI